MLAFRAQASTTEAKALDLYNELKRRKKLVIEDRVFFLDDVSVSKGGAVMSGWNIYVFPVNAREDTYAIEHYERGEYTYLKLRMLKPGVVIVVGEEPGRTMATVVYS